MYIMVFWEVGCKSGLQEYNSSNAPKNIEGIDRMKELVSVIVPIYNAETCIENCIEHLLKQSYVDIEIILVDDGSSDNTGIICKKYEKQESRIRYIKQDNKGQGGARNTGLELSSGEYVVFCDSDDYLLYSGVESLMVHKNEAELIVGGLEKVEHKRLVMHLPHQQIVRDEESIAGSLIDQMYCLNTPVNKLFRNSIIKKHNIRFNDFKYGQDTCFVYEYISVINSISFIPDIIYHVNVTQGSMSLRKVLNPWNYMQHIYELGTEIIPDKDDKNNYCLLLRVIKTTLLLELRNGKTSFLASIDCVNEYLHDNNILFKKNYGWYNTVVYELLKRNRKIALYIVMRLRNCLL